MENFPYIALISWIFFPCLTNIQYKKMEKYGWIFHAIMIFYRYHGKQNKIQTRSRHKAYGSGTAVLRYHHYAYRTENTYCDWIVRYIKYFGAKKHPRDMGKTEIDAYLSHLATERKVSASTNIFWQDKQELQDFFSSSWSLLLNAGFLTSTCQPLPAR